MSSSLGGVLAALEALLGATPEPCEKLDLEQALAMSAATLSSRQSCLVELAHAVSADGGFPKENAVINSIVADIQDRDTRWMAMLRALRHQSQQQALSRQRLRQLGSRANASTQSVGKMRGLG